MKVLIVEDEDLIAQAVRHALEREGHDAAVAGTARAGLRLADSWRPDVVLLDMMLPDGDGRDVARSIRQMSNVPIIIVTARGGESDRVAGLDLGADDYVVKPFGMPELLARIRAVSRRSRQAALDGPTELRHGNLTVEIDSFRAYASGALLELSRKEFQILKMLMERAGRVVERADLARAIWGQPAPRVQNTIDAHMASLRQKIGTAATIETVRGIGFRLADA